MRIIAGIWRGRPLVAPPKGTRPTLDRVRQVAFDIIGPKISGARVLDLFAGSGALGLEALSRGAERAEFVEASRGGARILERNIDSLQAGDFTRVQVAKVVPFLKRALASEVEYDWIFADPPYGGPDVKELLALLESTGPGLLHPEGTLLLETSRRDPIPVGTKLRLDRERTVGETVLSFFRWSAESERN